MQSRNQTRQNGLLYQQNDSLHFRKKSDNEAPVGATLQQRHDLLVDTQVLCNDPSCSPSSISLHLPSVKIDAPSPPFCRTLFNHRAEIEFEFEFDE